MWIKTSCRLELDYEYSTPIILMLRPLSGANQWVSQETFQLSEQVNVTAYTDHYGNVCQKLIVPAGGFVIDTTASIDTADGADVGDRDPFVSVMDLPIEVLQFLLPSRYCESDRFGIETMDLVSGCEPGYEQVARIDGWIRDNVRYSPGSSGVPCAATEIKANGEGVCKDLAHLGIAMCRSISIPARFVVGYLHGLEPMDLHAWFEAYIGNRWYVFDPTQTGLMGARVALAYGRDAADVSIYHQFGAPARYTDMRVSVVPIET
jgi:transglutaminase-like putative cysteine protease